MGEKNIELKDESNDRGYFTIIPNYILNHSTAVAQALYLQLKRLAGENGVAYAGSRYLKERLKISQPTLRKEFNYLLAKGWIEYAGEKEVETDGGKQKIKSYKIVDLWQLNNKFYESKRGEKIDTPCQRGEKIDTQGVKTRGEKIDTKEEPYKKNTTNKRFSFKSTSYTDTQWQKVLMDWRRSGGRVIDNKKLIKKKNGTLWLKGKSEEDWQPYEELLKLNK